MKRIAILLLACLALASQAWAATTKFMESGTDATQDLSFYGATAGVGVTIQSDTTISHTGPRSLQVQNAAASNAIIASPTGILADAGRSITFYVNFGSTLPTASSNIFLRVSTGAATSIFTLRLNTSGHIEVATGATVMATGTATIVASTWYQVSVDYTITSTATHHIRTFVDRVQDGDESNAATLASSVSSIFRFESNQDGMSHIFNIHFDDVFVDDRADFAAPSNILVTAKRPNASGTLNEWTTQIGVSGSGYGTGHAPQVNEQPLSETNGWSFQNAATKTEEYSVEGRSTGDVDITGATLVDWVGWVWEKVGSASTGNIIVGGTTSNIALTTSYAFFFAAKGSTTYPAGNTDVGADTNTVNQLFSLAECGVLVAYVSGTATPLARSLTTLGVGD